MINSFLIAVVVVAVVVSLLFFVTLAAAAKVGADVGGGKGATTFTNSFFHPSFSSFALLTTSDEFMADDTIRDVVLEKKLTAVFMAMFGFSHSSSSLSLLLMVVTFFLSFLLRGGAEVDVVATAAEGTAVVDDLKNSDADFTLAQLLCDAIECVGDDGCCSNCRCTCCCCCCGGNGGNSF